MQRKSNKTIYNNPGKPIKQTSFTVKNLEGNLPQKQFTIVKTSFRSSIKPLSLDSTIPVEELTTKTLQFMNATLLHESQYVVTPTT